MSSEFRGKDSLFEDFEFELIVVSRSRSYHLRILETVSDTSPSSADSCSVA